MRKWYRRNFRSEVGRKTCVLAGLAVAGGALLAIPSSVSAIADEEMILQGHVTIPNLTSFDISWVDADDRLYFLADRTNKSVDIIPIGPNPVGLPIGQLTRLIPQGVNAFAGLGTGCSTGTATDCAGPNGVMVITTDVNGRELWVADGPTVNPACHHSANSTCSTIKVFTAQGQNTPVRTIPTDGQFRADEFCWDPVHKIVLVANDVTAETGGAYVSFIPTEGGNAYQVSKTIHFPEATNGIEQCQYNNETGFFQINIPEVNGPGSDVQPGAVYTLDPEVMTVVGHHEVSLFFCAGPQGMAIGPDGQTLLGCNAFSPPNGDDRPLQNSTIVFSNSLQKGDNDADSKCRLKGLGGSDQVWYNPDDGHYFLALGSHAVPGSQGDPGSPAGANNGSQQQMAVVDHEQGKIEGPDCTNDQTIPVGSAGGTGRRSHSIAADKMTDLVALPVSAIGGGGALIPPTAGFQSDLCGNDELQGCIAVFLPEFLDQDDERDRSDSNDR